MTLLTDVLTDGVGIYVYGMLLCCVSLGLVCTALNAIFCHINIFNSLLIVSLGKDRGIKSVQKVLTACSSSDCMFKF